MISETPQVLLQGTSKLVNYSRSKNTVNGGSTYIPQPIVLRQDLILTNLSNVSQLTGFICDVLSIQWV